MLCFKLLDHFLLLIVGGRFEVRTVLYMFGDTFLTSLGLIFVSSFVANRTRFISFQLIKEVWPSCEFLLAPSPGNALGEVLGHKGNIFFIILQ